MLTLAFTTGPEFQFFTMFFKLNKFQFLSNPPVTSTQCTIPFFLDTITVYIICISVCYTQTRTCSDPSSLRHIYTQTLSVERPLTQAHTQTMSVDASSNSSLRHIYTHNPKRGTTPATAHSGTYTNPSVKRPQQQLTQAHKPKRGTTPATAHSGTYIHTNPERGAAPATAHSGTYIHTNPSVERLQQQLTLVYTNKMHITHIPYYSNSSRTPNSSRPQIVAAVEASSEQ